MPIVEVFEGQDPHPFADTEKLRSLAEGIDNARPVKIGVNKCMPTSASLTKEYRYYRPTANSKIQMNRQFLAIDGTQYPWASMLANILSEVGAVNLSFIWQESYRIC